MYLLSDPVSIPDGINVHIVGACSVCNQVDFREFCLQSSNQQE